MIPPPPFLPRVVRSSHSNNKLGLNGAGDERGDGEKNKKEGRGWRESEKVMGMSDSN